MVNFLATSSPFKSSLGSGSVYPSSFALRTSADHNPPAPSVGVNELNRKDIVPLNTPSILMTSSPVSIRSFKVEITGSPAPTELSWNIRAPDFVAAVNMSCHRCNDPENAFLFGVTILIPLARN
ncbi:BgTH12-03218 [Blumeria graminis f. sp. triticale]|uniref:BgTH12-03218 n=1 Tax=Blumeria graminis f. sp. triticale TaxID=1689686 RepID=A0A9W4GG72_BLUGR|nr:BgTH12-03218 [Blumeria graminis f. sp. triticale]